jgi:5-oxoprolinase (ATP-hydrolysing)
LESGHFVSGPAIVLNAGSTLIIEPNWTAQCLCDGTLQLVKTVRTPLQIDGPSESLEEPFDPIFRDCYAQRMAAIATQMGIVLQRTAVSVNVKQRRDFSCAIFDSSGCLLANAPHVPVHLGAMGQTVRAIQHEFSDISPGDSFITNDPYCGGSHLPDVTLVTPVFSTSDAADGPQQGTDLAPLFFVANRAHHADIGGIAPGSMSVVATQLGQEGVVIPPMRIVASGEDCTDLVRAVMLRSPFPPRNVDENLADLKAQLAANARGVELLRQYAGSTSWTRLAEYGNHLLEASELRVRQYVAGCPPFDCRFTDYLDDGTPLCVHISTSQTNDLYIDFSGSGPVSQTNFNANTSIVTSAVMYVLRCLVADELPLSEGVMRCVKLRIPQGILNPPKVAEVTERPAVAAGNVETSQRIVDVLLGALGAAAASQGTMNNLLFGNQRFGFYETICGGAGATDGAAGANAVHTHMTNTRLTDPEVLEARYPVRLVDFRLRTASGGKGRWNGGDGVVRRIEFLERMQLSLLTSRRGAFAPFGLQGGEPGLTGQNTLYRSDGTRIRLEGCQQIDVDVGDQLELQTPGGGGFGPCDSTDETTL